VAFTFLPPQPSYTVERVAGSDDCGKIVYLAEQLKNFNFYQQAAEHAEVHIIKTSRGERVPLVWMRPTKLPSVAHRSVKDHPIVLLHCHGNATDIGMMMGPYFEMAKQMGIEVAGVEYSGYGTATGSPGAANTYADVEAACDFLTERGVPLEKIVAYGQSVGSGPATYIGSKRQIGGVILHSPLMSGIKVIDPHPDRCCRPSCIFGCCDFYPNDKRCRKATCPTFVIHGQVDDIVPFHHGHRLCEMTPSEYRWPGYFPPGAGHNNIVEMNTTMYFQELFKFLRHVAERAGSNSSTVGGIMQRPLQLEMQGIGAREGDRLCNNGAEPWDGEAVMSFPEPVVGPEDSRYAGMRRDKSNTGGARSLQPVPLGNGATDKYVPGA